MTDPRDDCEKLLQAAELVLCTIPFHRIEKAHDVRPFMSALEILRKAVMRIKEVNTDEPQKSV